jgi:hypothetical protein
LIETSNKINIFNQQKGEILTRKNVYNLPQSKRNTEHD